MKVLSRHAATACCCIHQRQAQLLPRTFRLAMTNDSVNSPTRDWFADGRDAAKQLKQELGLNDNKDVIGFESAMATKEEKDPRETALESGRAAARALLDQMKADNNIDEQPRSGMDISDGDEIELPDSDHFTLPSQKSHCLTICMVPPPSAKEAWSQLSSARRTCRDPGFYRWPPHVNLLYPFVEPVFDIDKDLDKASRNDKKVEIRSQFMKEVTVHLSKAASKCIPFDVTIDSFGVFGGQNRGVMWADPKSSHSMTDSHSDVIDPLSHLQNELEKQFPTCKDQKKQGKFTPHMTISHYANNTDALEAKETVQSAWEPISFHISEVYLLSRKGDDGQFNIAATVPLGLESVVTLHDPPIRFPGMPLEEEEWVLDERMKMKDRRKKNFKRYRRK